MKKYRLFLLLAAITPVFLLGVVKAHADTTSGESNSGTDAQSSTEAETQPQTTIAERIQQRKDALKIKLTAKQTASLKLRCKASQGVVSSLSGRVKGIETSRAEVYGNITDNLTKLATKLQNKDIDSNELQGEINTLQTKIANYKTDLSAYKLAVDDLSSLDCQADPTAFKTTLEAARTARQKVEDDVKDIRTYVTDTIKPTLAKIRDGLKTKEQPSTQQ